jgi:hypothetical protein
MAGIPHAPNGATWGDAVIHLTDFAQANPSRFLEVILPTLAVGLLVLYFIWQIFVVGPVAKLKNDFDKVRAGSSADEGA